MSNETITSCLIRYNDEELFDTAWALPSNYSRTVRSMFFESVGWDPISVRKEQCLQSLKFELPKSDTYFSRFAMEPTFTPDLKKFGDMQAIVNYEENYEEVNEFLVEKVLPNIEKDFEKAHNDENVLEIPTEIFNSFSKFSRYYKKMVSLCKKNGFTESSNTCMEVEGGCHLNFDLGKFNREQIEKFVRRLSRYLNNNPSICWSFLSPYDNVSANIKVGVNTIDNYPFFGKGDFLTYFNDRLELRFFMMPRDFSEMKLNYDFAVKLLRYCFKTINNKSAKVNSKTDLQNKTFEGSVVELKKVCKEIGFDFKLLSGKVKLMKERFTFGKEFLN